MQKILRSPASIRRKPLKGTFGVALSELIRIQNGQIMVPRFMEKVVEHIKANGLNQEGIFRVNGSTKAVDKMKSKFDKSQDADLDETVDVMAVAGLLKLYLRELPDPLMTTVLHEQFISLQKDYINKTDTENYLPQLRNLLLQLPEENYLVLYYLCQFLVKVTEHEDENKMNSRALSIVFGPNLFRCSEGVAGLQEQAYTNVIVRSLIEDFEFLFRDGRSKEDIGSHLPDTSKRIVVRPAVEKRSPPVKPVSYEQYLKERLGKAFARRDAEERDVNSNSLEKRDEDMRMGFDRQDAMSPCDISSADERALSPFNLDSDSTIPSPIVSDSAIEVVDRAIKECISEHLFGSPDEHAPVPNPRTKRLQKKQREATSNKSPSQTNSESSEDMQTKLVKERVRQLSIDSIDSVSPPITPLAKTQPDAAASAFKFFESQGILLQSSKGNKVLPTKPETKKADKELNNTNSPSSRRKQDHSNRFYNDVGDDDVFKEDDLNQVERSSPVPDKVTEVRAVSPRTNKHAMKSKRSQENPEDIVPTHFTELDLDSVQREPVLQKLTEGRVTPPRTRTRSRSRDRSEGKNIVSNVFGNGLLTNGSLQQSSHDHQPSSMGLLQPASKKKTSPHKVLAEAALAARLKKQQGGDEGGRGQKQDKKHGTANDSSEITKTEHGKEKSQQDVVLSPKKKGKKKPKPARDANDLRVRDVDSPEMGVVVESKHGKKKRSTSSTSEPGRHDKVKAGMTNGREDEKSTSPKATRLGHEEDSLFVPSLDFSSLHANAESDEPIPAWSLQQRADWMNTMEELTIDVRAGPVEKVARNWEEAPLSPRAKDTPPCWGSSTKEDKPLDKSMNIKQLTRQVRNLKRRIRQYEEDYSAQHGHKPSTAEKAAEPEVKKMMRELKKAAKQLKAVKEQGTETNKPLHSTMPGSTKKQDDSNSESSIVDSLRDALDLAEEYLKEKRKEAGRMDDIFEMSKSEVHDEKVSIQKVLLQLENKYGRPTTRETKEIMKPLYDRYRNLKRLIAKFEVRRTLAEEVVSSSPPDLNTIDEHEETKEFTPKQLGDIHTMYAEDEEPCMVTQDISPGVRGHMKSADLEETIQSPVDLSGRADSPLSPDSTANFKNLADASLSELINAQNQALSEKKRIRRILKEFEDNFFKDKGRKVQKEDRGAMEDEYHEYKRVKKQLKLLDALMEKHESQTNTGVT